MENFGKRSFGIIDCQAYVRTVGVLRFSIEPSVSELSMAASNLKGKLLLGSA